MIKCVGCYDLLREEITRVGEPLIVYNCPRFFPYACALSGLLHPGSGIVEAVEDCAVLLYDHCILCASTDLMTYGYEPIVFICKEHDKAWSKWLDDHPGKREYISPGKRVKKDRWIEVFREFIEDMREK